MAKVSKTDLVSAALRAREGAVAPYSQFKVGAALLTKTGVIITGAVSYTHLTLPTILRV